MWLDGDEQRQLRAAVDDPQRELAVRLGLHGLRAAEIVAVEPGDVRPLPAAEEVALLRIDGKRGLRDVPLRAGLADALRYGSDGVGVGSTRTVERWVKAAREELRADTGVKAWKWLTPHDLRRSWATGLYYRLATAGVPNAEELVMSWGGWRQSASGRDTFRTHYLGPVPDAVTADALAAAGWA